MDTAGRRLNRPGGPAQYQGTTKEVNGSHVWNGVVRFAEHKIIEPLKWTKPRTVFVNSMGDLFHENVPDAWIDRVFAIMALCPHHTFIVLTKRAAGMQVYCANPRTPVRIARVILDMAAAGTVKGSDALRPLRDRLLESDPEAVFWPLTNVWKGVSCEDQRRADERISDLLATPAAVRFVSAEPLLGPIEFDCPWPPGWQRPIDDVSDGVDALRYAGEQGRPLDWVIVGGESGTAARPMHPDWVRSIRDQCAGAGVPFFFKQWGAFVPIASVGAGGVAVAAATPDHHVWADTTVSRRTDKKAAGRLLDGREHTEWPKGFADA